MENILLLQWLASKCVSSWKIVLKSNVVHYIHPFTCMHDEAKLCKILKKIYIYIHTYMYNYSVLLTLNEQTCVYRETQGLIYWSYGSLFFKLK